MDYFGRSCRICSMEHTSCTQIFSEEGKKLYLQAKIRKYLYITVSVDDKLPKMICEYCCKKIEGIHKFATMAIKIQDKFNKIITNTSNLLESKYMENKGLLHTYLTKGVRDVSDQDSEITEMEVRVDPMMILQCSLDEDGLSSESNSDSDSDSNGPIIQLKSSDNNFKNSSSTSPGKEKTLYNCPECPMRYNTEFALQNHMWKHSSSHGERKVLVNCQSNSIKAEHEERINESTENGTNMKFTCPVCGKIISTKGNLKVHLETHRPKGKYGCDICGRIFKTQSNLHRHKEYHGGIQYPCGVCGRVYPTNSTLRAHSITHSDLRPHKCPLCEKTFKRNQDLKFHINQHTGARPYQCPYCPKAFASSGNCFSHRKRMHPLEVERDRERAAEIMR